MMVIVTKFATLTEMIFVSPMERVSLLFRYVNVIVASLARLMPERKPYRHMAHVLTARLLSNLSRMTSSFGTGRKNVSSKSNTFQ